MKKIILLATVFSLVLFSSCSPADGEDGKNGLDGKNGKDGVNIQGQAYEIKNFNFIKDRNVSAGTNYFYSKTFATPLAVSDNVFVYRLVGTVDSQTPVWEPIPKSWYFNGGGVTYDFYFSKLECDVVAYSNLDLATVPQWINNQTIRILVVPSTIVSQANFNKNDYNSVINAIHADETEIKILN
jgi:hypothetical protein